MSGLPTDVNPVDVAIEMLVEALPGFESRFVDGRDSVGIRGALPIGAVVSRELIMYPIYRSPVFMSADAKAMFDAVETDEARAIRHARQREVLQRELAPTVGHIVDEIRRRAIEAVGLDSVIVERERRAHERGRRIGFEEGRARGIHEGRIEAMREWQEAAEGIRDAAARIAGIWEEADDE